MVVRRVASLLLLSALTGPAGSAHADPALHATTPSGALSALVKGADGESTNAIRSVELENPGALRSFFTALGEARKKQDKVRIAYYGDSHTAPDVVNAQLREQLFAAFGEGGAGFVTAAKPWPYHRHSMVEYVESKGFKGVRITRSVRSGSFGLFGAALEAKKKARAVLRTRPGGGGSGHASEIELYYLKQPGGGQLRVLLDGKRVAQLSTDSRRDKKRGKELESRAGYLRFEAAKGAHEIALTTLGDGPVTLFGLTLEQARGGVVIDTLGIPGARAKFHALWEEGLYKEHLQRRAPELVVLAYGTNEAGDEDLSLGDYEQTLRKTVLRIRGYLPGVGCLLVGPTDRPERLDDGSLAPRASIPAIIAVQRKVARELDCAFFDVEKAMGGPMSIVRLAQLAPPLAQRDYVHLNQRGYEQLGNALSSALMAAYREQTSNKSAREGK